MMKVKLAPVVAFFLSAVFGSFVCAKETGVLTKTQGESYIRDAHFRPVRSSNGLCVRSRKWTEYGRTPSCDPSHFQKRQRSKIGEVHPTETSHSKGEPHVVYAHPTPVEAPHHVKEHVIDNKLTISASTFFDTSSSVLRDSSRVVLTRLGHFLDEVKLEVVVVSGYADSRGSKALNDRLTLDRANAVKAYLITQGVKPRHIHAEGKGASKPVGDNRTASGRAKNRRVEIEVIGTTSLNTEHLPTFVGDSQTLDSSLHHRTSVRQGQSLPSHVHAGSMKKTTHPKKTAKK